MRPVSHSHPPIDMLLTRAMKAVMCLTRGIVMYLSPSHRNLSSPLNSVRTYQYHDRILLKIDLYSLIEISWRNRIAFEGTRAHCVRMHTFMDCVRGDDDSQESGLGKICEVNARRA